MSRAEAIQIAEDVKTLLNSATTGQFAQDFTAVRRYVPVNDRDALANLTVSVVAKSSEANFFSRSQVENTSMVDIAIQKALAKPEDLDEIDALTLISDQVIAFVSANDSSGATRRLLPTSKGRLMRANNSPLYDPTHMKDQQIFTGLITLTYETAKVFA